jgi:hypothetical protein
MKQKKWGTQVNLPLLSLLVSRSLPEVTGEQRAVEEPRCRLLLKKPSSKRKV